jgi:hypothetical protein
MRRLAGCFTLALLAIKLTGCGETAPPPPPTTAEGVPKEVKEMENDMMKNAAAAAK